jgi:hypothetical protein
MAVPQHDAFVHLERQILDVIDNARLLDLSTALELLELVLAEVREKKPRKQ